jgi:hypothetical protein
VLTAYTKQSSAGLSASRLSDESRDECDEDVRREKKEQLGRGVGIYTHRAPTQIPRDKHLQNHSGLDERCKMPSRCYTMPQPGALGRRKLGCQAV